MIGIFKINTKEKYRTLAISEDGNVTFYHCLETKSAIVQPLSCEDNKFFHVVEKYLMKPEESETPIYNMALELENINLHELTLEIKGRLELF